MTPKRKADVVLDNIDKVLKSTEGQDTISIDRQDVLDLMIMYSIIDNHLSNILTTDNPVDWINTLKMQVILSEKDIFGLPK